MKTAIFTIVSRNYMALSRVLREGVLAHQPEADFFTFLCDRLAPEDGLGDEPGLITLDRVSPPRASFFFAKYTILEANTAVKPWVFEHLLFDLGYERVLYLDPDIQLHGSLSPLIAPLEHGANVTLTPHMRRPPEDGRTPDELSILQSGTYNLGVIGLRRSEETARLTAWWQEILYHDCVVDIPRGLFVDQKWMDLAPGYFDGVVVVRDPTCNVAYWNLHERKLSRVGEVFNVDGDPLRFFHFSGYSPFDPDQLSKHQSRHDLGDLPVVRALCDGYAEALFANGHTVLSVLPYAFEQLPNGVKLPEIVRVAFRLMIDCGIEPPDPWDDPDDFARALMSVDPRLGANRLAPLQCAILARRPDVAEAYPAVFENPFDEGFARWFAHAAPLEYDIRRLRELCPEFLEGDPVRHVFDTLDRGARTDVFAAFEGFWFDAGMFDGFCQWIGTHGGTEHDFTPAHAAAFSAARHGPSRIIGLWLQDAELQAQFSPLWDDRIRQSFIRSICRHARQYALTPGECTLFERFCQDNAHWLMVILGLYGRQFRTLSGRTPNRFSLRGLHGANPGQSQALIRFLDSDKAPDWVQQLYAYYQPIRETAKPAAPIPARSKIAERFARDITEGRLMLPRQELVRLSRELSTMPACETPQINLAGYFKAPTGMGASARSMRSILTAAALTPAEIALPTPHDRWQPDADNPMAYGWPTSPADLSITIANADATGNAERFLPATYWAPVNIGYWVWETELFPPRFARNARPYDAIWTPSHFSAAAIARVVDIPVSVVPHVIDLPALAGIRADRARFGLRDDRLSFGFVLDPRSNHERKNPEAAVNAFRTAFGNSDAAELIIKSNGPLGLDKREQRLRDQLLGYPNIRLIEAHWPLEDVYRLIASLDVYVSLHRAEGFGLTLAEAMALGKPVIATDYSGNTDFMDSSCACMVPARLIETDRAHGPYLAGSRWADPDIESAARYMMEMRDSTMRAALGLRARQAVYRKLSPAAIARQFRQLLSRMV